MLKYIIGSVQREARSPGRLNGRRGGIYNVMSNTC